MSASNPKLLKDADLIITKALPNGAASTATDGIDLGHGANGDWLADVEFEVSAPALTTAEQPDDKTMTYIIEHDTDSAFGSAATLIDRVIVQTGAGGAGADAATKRVRLPSDCNRYIRLKATGSATGNSSTKSMTLTALT